MSIFVKKAIQYFTNLHVFNKETRGRPFVEVSQNIINRTIDFVKIQAMGIIRCYTTPA
jgi:hypothetical protein